MVKNVSSNMFPYAGKIYSGLNKNKSTAPIELKNIPHKEDVEGIKRILSYSMLAGVGKNSSQNISTIGISENAKKQLVKLLEAVGINCKEIDGPLGHILNEVFKEGVKKGEGSGTASVIEIHKNAMLKMAELLKANCNIGKEFADMIEQSVKQVERVHPRF